MRKYRTNMVEMALKLLFTQFLSTLLWFANIEKRNLKLIPIMMSSIQPITASKEASVAEELEGKIQEKFMPGKCNIG